MLINLGLTSYDYPDNMKFLIQFMKSFLQGRKIINGTGLGEIIGLHKFVEVTRTSSFNQYFNFTGFTTQSLIVNMGLLSTIFGLIML